MNVILNAFVYFILLFMTFTGVIIFTVSDDIYYAFEDRLIDNGIVTPDTGGYGQYAVMTGYVASALKLLLWVIIGYGLLSAFISNQSFLEYVLIGIFSVFITALLVFFGSFMWNALVTSAGSSLDFAGMAAGGLLVIAENFAGIMLANLIAGLMSFAYQKMRGRNASFVESVY